MSLKFDLREIVYDKKESIKILKRILFVFFLNEKSFERKKKAV